MKKIFCLLMLATAIFQGCASNCTMAPARKWGEMGLTKDPEQISQLEKSMTDKDIARMLDVKVSSKLPTTLAVAKLACGYQPYLDTIDAEELKRWSETIRPLPEIRGICPLTTVAHPQEEPTLHSLRTAAARMNCELLLVYLQQDNTVDNYNDAAALYWTFVGLWVVPGNVYEHRTVMQAALIDCRTGMILGTATGDCHKKQTCAAAYKGIYRDKFSVESPTEAFADLLKGSERMLAGVVAAARSCNAQAKIECQTVDLLSR